MKRASRPGRIEIGGIARAHGIRGEVAIVTHDPDSTLLEHCGAVWVDGTERQIAEARPTPKGWLVLFAGVTTRTEAEALRGRPVEVDRALLELEDGDVILHDLVGCKVTLADGTAWGEVAEIDSNGFQDLLVIHDGPVERMLPLIDQFVTKIDLEAGVVTVEPPPGLPESKR